MVNTSNAVLLYLFLSLKPLSISALVNTRDEIRLHNFLFAPKKYNTYVRPVLDRNHSLDVIFHRFYLYCIMDLDEKLQVMKSSGWLTITWKDELLMWNRSDFGGIKETLVSQDRVWKPDIVVNNAVDTVSKGLGFSELAVKINSDGLVLWEPGDVFQTLCIVDVSNFPFDTQYCIYEFSTWMYLSDDINLTVAGKSVDMRFYHENGEWEVMETTAFKFDETYEPYAGAVYKLTLRRRRGVYILNIIVPIILLSFLNSFVFILPAESGEKTALCVTSMLSFMVYLSSIVDMVPKTSIKIPLVVVYLVIMLSFSAVSVIFTVIVLFTYQRQNARIPACLQFLVRCRSRSRGKTYNLTQSVDPKRARHSKNDNLILPEQNANDNDKPVTENGDYHMTSYKTTHYDCRRDNSDVEDNWESLDSLNWKRVAETLDRIFFYCVFSLSTSMSFLTVAILALK